MQFDLFDESYSVALRNDVILALERDDPAAASTALNRLRSTDPQDACLDALEQITQALHQRSPAPLSDHDALSRARSNLTQNLTPAAQRGLGQHAPAWLRRRWQELAQRAGSLAYCAGRPEDHAAPLWLQAGAWQACADAVAGIASWRRIPAPLSWMLHARLRLQGAQANWGLLAELAWIAPQRLRAVLAQVDEPLVQTLLARFDASFEGEGDERDLAWFAAWVLTERPELASALTQAQAGLHTEPEQAMRLLLELLGLERQGRHHEVIAHRKTLRQLHAGLSAAYMARR